MFRNLLRAARGRASAPASVAASLLALASFAHAQEPAQTPQPTAEAARADATNNKATKTTAPADAVRPAAPLYSEYRGVKVGMTAAEVRSKLGKAEEQSDAMDFYVFSERERARVYYTDGKATAIIATYIGLDADAPAPKAVLGEDVEAKADGSMYKMMTYPQAGYWVAYSRTAGDQPMTIITMRKTP